MNTKRALITGITGFIGPHLADALLSEGNVTVMGTCQDGVVFQPSHVPKNVELFPMDLTDRSSVMATVSKTNPDYIFHLAGHSNVVRS